ncbi:hypothetical protein H0H81_000011 [Sphagnurus paluster]|uniref:Uncharacterized protein n=1 Tax=Sphagnurus paluster TaxID=117069 RepID=A0A9P7K629_9AGAR|nr:hypothetical protein H0H81_000011 [Sphagnurus paluster]
MANHETQQPGGKPQMSVTSDELVHDVGSTYLRTIAKKGAEESAKHTVEKTMDYSEAANTDIDGQQEYQNAKAQAEVGPTGIVAEK